MRGKIETVDRDDKGQTIKFVGAEGTLKFFKTKPVFNAGDNVEYEVTTSSKGNEYIKNMQLVAGIAPIANHVPDVNHIYVNETKSDNEVKAMLACNALNNAMRTTNGEEIEATFWTAYNLLISAVFGEDKHE